MPHPLLTAELEDRLAPLYSQDGKGMESVVSLKLFSLTGWIFFFTEYDPEERLFFGYVIGDEGEWGYTSLDELEELNAARGIQVIARDDTFKPKTLREAIRELGRQELVA